jgi:protein-S-isoprenylcysteine O-methyltransferase Ste14
MSDEAHPASALLTGKRTTTRNDGPWPHLVAYCTAIALYFVGACTPGLTAPFPWQGCLICDSSGTPSSSLLWTQVVLGVMWCLHYGRRALESVCLFKFHRTRDWSERLAFLWYGATAFWIGLSVAEGPRPQAWLVGVGLAVFLIGEAGNAVCHVMLTRQRAQGVRAHARGISASHHVIPHGFAFEVLAVPHYVFEWVAWVGFFLATFTLATLFFAVASLLVMAPRAREADRLMRKEFGDEYAKLGRKLFIPGIV